MDVKRSGFNVSYPLSAMVIGEKVGGFSSFLFSRMGIRVGLRK
jgi:hypothetical protein